MAKFVKSTLFHYAKRDFGGLLGSTPVLDEGDYLAAVGQAFAEFMADYQAALVVAEDGGEPEGGLDDEENPFERVASVFYPAGVDDDSDDADGLPAPRSAGRTTPRSRSGSQLSRLSSVDSETRQAFTDVDIGSRYDSNEGVRAEEHLDALSGIFARIDLGGGGQTPGSDSRATTTLDSPGAPEGSQGSQDES